MPRDVCLDTSFVFEALASAQPHHDAARFYLERLADEEVTVHFNDLLEVELHQAAFQVPLKERFRKDWKRRRHDLRSRRRAAKLMDSVMESWKEILDALHWVQIRIDEVAPSYPDLMRSYGLESYDAVHAATASYVGVDHLVTNDLGFAAVPEERLTLLVNRSRVGSCRHFRSAQDRKRTRTLC